MKFTQALPLSLMSLATKPTFGFVHPTGQSVATGWVATSQLNSMDAERAKQIMYEEAMNKDNFQASAQQMQNMTPEQMSQMLDELENMPPAQLEQMKSMGMNPEIMKQSMKMMRDNPEMMKSVGKMMENMTPEQMMERSRQVQSQMAGMSPEEIRKAAEDVGELSPEQIDVALQATTATTTSAVEEEQEVTAPVATIDGIVPDSANDPAVVDAMYRVGELMSNPPTGGVTFAAFATLPPVTVLSGDREQDLSKAELKQCWEGGSLGSSRVNRQGFERVWKEVQEYFEDDIMEESRKTSKSRTSGSGAAASLFPASKPSTPSSPMVGSELSSEQMQGINESVKNMSDDDLQSMMDQMANITPEQEARMKAMGVDPGMMQKTANMMKNNPMARKAISSMMKNMSPEQMMKMSQQAQKQLADKPEDVLDAMEKDLQKFEQEN